MKTLEEKRATYRKELLNLYYANAAAIYYDDDQPDNSKYNIACGLRANAIAELVHTAETRKIIIGEIKSYRKDDSFISVVSYGSNAMILDGEIGYSLKADRRIVIRKDDEIYEYFDYETEQWELDESYFPNDEYTILGRYTSKKGIEYLIVTHQDIDVVTLMRRIK